MWGSGGGSPLIFNLITRWGVSGQLHASANLPKGYSLMYPLSKELGS